MLLIGAGKIAKLTAQVLRRCCMPEMAFINRTAERAMGLASEFDARAFQWDDLGEALAWADVVIAATSAAEMVVRLRDLSRRLNAGNTAPLTIVDMGAPRNVEPEVEALPWVRYAGVDDLDSSLDENLEKRRATVPQIEAIVAEEAEAYMTWFQERGIAPLITDLHRKMKQVADTELELALGTLGRLDPDHRQAIARLVHRITGKILHEPTVRLKSPDAAIRGYHHAIRHLFALTDAEPTASSS